MEVRVYGRLTEIMGSSPVSPEGIENTDQLKKKLTGLYPGLDGLTYAIAVNNRIVSGNFPLHPGDVVSLLPPFSGG